MKKVKGLTKDEIQTLFDKPQIGYKNHWLFEQRLRVQIDKETDCSDCLHIHVCDMTFEKRCVNYWLGTSAERGCLACTNHYSRYDKEPVPCFCCPYFAQLDANLKAVEDKICTPSQQTI